MGLGFRVLRKYGGLGFKVLRKIRGFQGLKENLGV